MMKRLIISVIMIHFIGSTAIAMSNAQVIGLSYFSAQAPLPTTLLWVALCKEQKYLLEVNTIMPGVSMKTIDACMWVNGLLHYAAPIALVDPSQLIMSRVIELLNHVSVRSTLVLIINRPMPFSVAIFEHERIHRVYVINRNPEYIPGPQVSKKVLYLEPETLVDMYNGAIYDATIWPLLAFDEGRLAVRQTAVLDDF